jgi:hypothetical protein
MKKEHEKKVLNTIADFISKRKSISINEIYYPDDVERNKKAPDMLMKSSSIEIVFEHTRIESYPGQIDDSVRIRQLLKPLESMLVGKLPIPGDYHLSIDIGTVKGAKATKPIQSALTAWIQEKSPLLQLPSPYEPFDKHYLKGKPKGVPFEVTLYRFQGGNGKFWITLAAPKDLEKKIRERIGIALEKKCPKLRTARSDKRMSILLFESNHIFFGNYLQTAEAIVKQCPLRNDIPDDIYLIETWPDPWFAWIIKDGANLFPNIDNPGPHYLEAALQ